ncbi:MAG TPA: uracil-DNA glycosylase [Dehalococcoidia bacterium]|nr:uracil-DNA glycosylase [Dehalococcoidia bacterium]
MTAAPAARASTVAFSALCRDVRACTACDRAAHTHLLGPANGPLDARVLFVAEAPGRRGAAVTGIPLTRDESGRRFEAFLALADLRRDDVFITNAVLCNPLTAGGTNRTPASREIARCRPHLERTLDLVRAPVVVTLGRVALESLRAITPHDADLSSDVARPIPWRNRTLVPLYHPGRRSTLHRHHETQEHDWRILANILNNL